MVWVTFLGFSVGIRRTEHMGITFISNYLSKLSSLIVNFSINLFALFFTIILFKEGIIFSLQGLKTYSPVLGITNFWAYLSIPMGAFFMTIQIMLLIFDNIDSILKYRRGETNIQ